VSSAWIVLAILFSALPAHATSCTCRDAIPADSSGSGTCTKTQDGSRSCRFDWNSGNSTRSQYDQTVDVLKHQGISVPELDGFGDAFEKSSRALAAPAQASTALAAVSN
jgi:hypothetical protein